MRVNSACRSLNVLMAGCVVVLLTSFWTYFDVSDNGMEFLLGSLKRFFEISGASSQLMAGLAISLPGTLYFFRKKIGLVNVVFVKQVVFPKCHALYEFDKCYHTLGRSPVSNKCPFVRFPKHIQRWRRLKINATL